MKTLILIFFAVSAYAINIKKFDIDHRVKSKEFDVAMISGKKDGIRFYQGTISDVLALPVNTVLDTVLAFDKRCNNELSDKRTLSNKFKKCPFSSDSLIESVIVNDLKIKKLDKNEIKRFVVKRRSYNRGLYTYNDLIRVYRYMDGFKITMEMMDDKLSKSYISSPLSNNSVMQTSGGVYYIMPAAGGRTRYTYTFTCSTDHWLLNKSITVSTFFSNMAKNLRDEFNTIKN
ncbi:hypothetical protein ABMA70_07305 [Halobacteriovorax sp. XZX-3]|uniref:hypothetical protein n=1 Tax=unclassified Halobacteriovorax TaxID=2639665 RepID=UPI000CD0A290|nr:hypothetical protein [Halobacteriovorax sp. DA5]POB12867.1 hypothetical protein C0Z22_13395 [Halobacteriovorax sp. DA5]